MPPSANPDHDQRLKVLLKEFFEAFFLCFFPDCVEDSVSDLFPRKQI